MAPTSLFMRPRLRYILCRLSSSTISTGGTVVTTRALKVFALAAVLALVLPALNAQNNGCNSLPRYSELKAALAAATAAETSGLNNQMWATLVDKDGIVC